MEREMKRFALGLSSAVGVLLWAASFTSAGTVGPVTEPFLYGGSGITDVSISNTATITLGAASTPGSFAFSKTNAMITAYSVNVNWAGTAIGSLANGTLNISGLDQTSVLRHYTSSTLLKADLSAAGVNGSGNYKFLFQLDPGSDFSGGQLEVKVVPGGGTLYRLDAAITAVPLPSGATAGAMGLAALGGMKLLRKRRK
jgi:hypothetical protein